MEFAGRCKVQKWRRSHRRSMAGSVRMLWRRASCNPSPNELLQSSSQDIPEAPVGTRLTRAGPKVGVKGARRAWRAFRAVQRRHSARRAWEACAVKSGALDVDTHDGHERLRIVRYMARPPRDPRNIVVTGWQRDPIDSRRTSSSPRQHILGRIGRLAGAARAGRDAQHRGRALVLDAVGRRPGIRGHNRQSVRRNSSIAERVGGPNLTGAGQSDAGELQERLASRVGERGRSDRRRGGRVQRPGRAGARLAAVECRRHDPRPQAG